MRSVSSVKDILEHQFGDSVPSIVILEMMSLRVTVVRQLVQGHMTLAELELGSRSLNDQTTNFPTVWSCSPDGRISDIDWRMAMHSQGGRATCPPKSDQGAPQQEVWWFYWTEEYWQRLFCSLWKLHLLREGAAEHCCSFYWGSGLGAGWERGEWKRNERQERAKQGKEKINTSLQAGGSCGCDEYLPCSGLMISEMFFWLYWALVGLFFKK